MTEEFREPGERINLSGISNTRDLGGYETLDGRRLKRRRLLRSGALGNASKEDLRLLKETYQLKTIVDFRTEAETKENPDPEIEGVAYIHNPILKDEQMGITRKGEKTQLLDLMLKSAKDMCEKKGNFIEELYPSFITNDYSRSQYRKFFEILLNQKEGAVLWHCSAGKDRVGTGTALVLAALGVSRKDIIKDYLLTNQYLQKETERLMELAAAKVNDSRMLEQIRILNGVNASYIQGVFDTIGRQYQSMDYFLKQEMGLDEDKRTRLQQMYLEVTI